MKNIGTLLHTLSSLYTGRHHYNWTSPILTYSENMKTTKHLKKNRRNKTELEKSPKSAYVAFLLSKKKKRKNLLGFWYTHLVCLLACLFVCFPVFFPLDSFTTKASPGDRSNQRQRDYWIRWQFTMRSLSLAYLETMLTSCTGLWLWMKLGSSQRQSNF